MLQLEIEDSGDEEEEEASAAAAEVRRILPRDGQESASDGAPPPLSSSSPSRRERKAFTTAAFSNTSISSPIASNKSGHRSSSGGGDSPDSSSFIMGHRFFRKSNVSGPISSSSCWWCEWWWGCCIWLWNGGQSSSPSLYSRWIRRCFILVMATLLFYHVTPTDWNPAKSDNEYTMKNDPPIRIIEAAAASSSSSDSQLTPNEKERVSPSRIGSTSFSSRKGDTGLHEENDDTTSAALHYSCPATVTPPENLISVDASSSLRGGSSRCGGTISMTPHAKLLQNTSAYLSVFHGVEYDEMSFYSYDSVKENMFHWKNTQFGDYLQDGDIIYESGCGIGLNLVMTLEILSEARGIQNLRVYGNDFSAESIKIARELMQPPHQQQQEPKAAGILSPTNGKLGTLCRADSAKLHDFVPANKFDLVFTGYITPLQDALHLNLSTPEDLDRAYRVICQEEKVTTTTPSRAADMQRRQEDWFGTWVSEMIRIAKPGAPVIVEQVSYPYCEAFLDGGGVSLDFWKIAVERYQWDINVDLIEFENDSIVKSRYHVAMRKNS